MTAPISASLSITLARTDALAHWETTPAWFGFLRANGLDPREIEPFAGTIGVVPCRFTPPPRRFRLDPDGADAAFFEVLAIEDGEIVVADLVAFDVADPTIFGTLEGCGVLLGADQIENPSRYLGDRPLLVHRTPLTWLRAGCQGVVVLDERRGGGRLAGALGNLLAEDLDHARALHRMMGRAFPTRRIRVPSASIRGQRDPRPVAR
ncbi:hypothetical protein EZH22_14070 [Xanthobacter dioxanivorans]|uniref:Uncharacterized protein n=1 Tax=Xanthobacter dioxanivorans TaxID=2528964 RepID=A0A974SM52_9HYPH|nr:hypothetical protein [Xanthobacter dioxanivorans]QRG09278.1 hypothetical protein EZH22_14070 [Xanthobacter dioxanivorans]